MRIGQFERGWHSQAEMRKGMEEFGDGQKLLEGVNSKGLRRRLLSDCFLLLYIIHLRTTRRQKIARYFTGSIRWKYYPKNVCASILSGTSGKTVKVVRSGIPMRYT